MVVAADALARGLLTRRQLESALRVTTGAYQRFLARLDIAAPPGAWALKGGMALLARLHDTARATKDADTTWRTSAAQLTAALDAAVALDLGDYFVFEVGRPRSLMAETDEGGQRFPVLALVDGREFERPR